MRPDELKVFGPLSAYNDEDREALAELLEERDLTDGKSAFREGAESEGLVLLAQGSMRLKAKRHGGLIESVEAPFYFGAVSLFSLGKREVTAIADGPCEIWVLPRSGLSRLAEDAPRAAFRLAEAALEELAALIRPGIDGLIASSED